jgi:hypothetical protein
MASKAVVDAIKARLEDWDDLPVVHPNETEESPADGSEYVRVDYPVAQSHQASIGAPGENLWREEGVFRLVIYAERGKDLDGAFSIAADLSALFRGVDFDGVETFAPSPPATNDESDNGNYYVLAVAVPYRYDLVG